jgi:hypothetical protein
MGRPARDPDAPAHKRIQMDLPPRSVERLQRLQERTDATSYGETIRHSLWLHETVLDLIEGGGTLLVEKDGRTTAVKLVGIEA